jgi:ABC-type Fe3+/spermidine/putrescine transport system ATPase subunit
MTPSGIETATFRFVAQYLNHCTTISGRLKVRINREILLKIIFIHPVPKNVVNAKLLYLPNSVNLQSHNNTNSASAINTRVDEAEYKEKMKNVLVECTNYSS